MQQGVAAMPSPLAVPPPSDPAVIRDALRALKHLCEDKAIAQLAGAHGLTPDERALIHELAVKVVDGARGRRRELGPLDALLQEFGLTNHEGIALMCIAECLLRVADPETADRLIAEKLSQGQWDTHLGHSDSAFVNATAWALALSGRLVELDPAEVGGNAPGFLKRVAQRAGEPVIRSAMAKAMRMMGEHFVMGGTIDAALAVARSARPASTVFSFDMLGEGARNPEQAERYFDAYQQAIDAVGAQAGGRGPQESSGVSIKLSALHPRYEFAQRARVMTELVPRVKTLALSAKRWNINFTIDAEEADRLDLSLDVVEALATDPDLAGWNGLGVAVQAYQKRAPRVIDWLAATARRAGRRFMVRLVKGAYWDSEIKHSQQAGHEDYPVYTRKAATDLSYLVCARRMLAASDAIFPQFATHNAFTIAAILHIAGENRDLEFQRLFGMGELLYTAARETLTAMPRVRVYAPVGTHADLLPYLIRRLLENGASSSFVNTYMDPDVPVGRVVADPVAAMTEEAATRHPKIPVPADIYGGERRNSRGYDLSAPETVEPLLHRIDKAMAGGGWTAAPIVGGRQLSGQGRPVSSPVDRSRTVGTLVEATAAQVEEAVGLAAAAQPGWDRLGGKRRADILNRMADALEADDAPLLGLLVHEAGKILPDATSELREAVDFCRYYAARAREQFGTPLRLPGPTGESNDLYLAGRGVFACISPWNFPLAIFVGQMAAALAAGNSVVAKPAEQTPLIAAEVVRRFHRAGVPGAVLHLLPGTGETVGARLVADPRVAGVAFTGSTETARAINRTLADRDGPIVPLIAETGGQNAMIVDSTALLEQVVDDCIQSAFLSAGQRCSALRVLYAQEEIADRLAAMLSGAMDMLTLGDPRHLATDVGPIIDDPARQVLEEHVRRMDREARLIKAVPVPESLSAGTFFGPRFYEIDGIARLPREVFGPVLHMIRFRSGEIDGVVRGLQSTGYGLTFGIHSRLETRAFELFRTMGVGNTYINRNMVGAVVGVQPFGGQGLSGTGPKAGGPHYLLRFATEKTLTVNTTAFGGNTALLALGG
ncbi:proline dehydrogenase [Rhodospirillum centenum SW]|uniref:Bifunctional protein PutA n=2 Tax=Rhodospirillum centenum TaxID=34018 RepID=B6ITG0_RHOCS|nr:proline dehydrogenase [Rhodospirillum centenum SW]